MLIAFNRITFIGLVSIFTYGATARQYGAPAKTLSVTEDIQPTGTKLTIIDRNADEGSLSHLGREKRQAVTLNSPEIPTNISTWTNYLNDSHEQLMVNWVGGSSKVIICLARDSSPRKKGLSPSALFISYDYGKNFTNKTESFRLGDTPDSGYAQLDKFFNHPKYPEFCVFIDSMNKKLYYTSDNGQTIHRSDLNFSPSELAFDEEFPDKYVILDKVDTNKKLYLTLDGGKTFKLIQSFVKTFIWSSGPGVEKVFYVEQWKPEGTSTVFSASDPTDLVNADVLFEDAKDFQIKGDYMFATKQYEESNSLHLYISHQRGSFFKAEFGTELDLRKFHIADVTDIRIFVSVMHSETQANLYVSQINNNFTQYNFVLSLEQIFCYFPDGNWMDSWLEDVTEDPFTDLYRVEGLKGIYIASQVDFKSSASTTIGPEHLVSRITFDHGVNWLPIKPPTEDENGMPLNCQNENSCSLHLWQKFSQLYPLTRSATIMSSKAAPGIIMATGVMSKSLKGIPGVYVSRDAGFTWKRILKHYYFFNYGDHGGVLVAVKYFKSTGETRRILYSTNEGIDWNSYQFNAENLRIYGLMTEPGENMTTFTVFGSAKYQHQWIIITIDLRNTFARNCTQDDYKFWSLSAPNSNVSCMLGSRNMFQRRLPHTNCYHGVGYERVVTKEVCECTRRDFECDFGFIQSMHECVRNKSAVKHDPYAIPTDCRPGNYYKRTKGYRKIDGDVCTILGYMSYAPDMIPCPIEKPQKFMLVALRDKIARIDLFDNSTLYPVKDQKKIVAIEFDIKNNCIYWADIEIHKISRQCFINGTAQEVVVDTDLASIEGMALDWISNVLFFVDGLRKKIEAVRTDLSNEGRMRRTIVDHNHLSKPRGITVHPRAGYLFWTDWDRSNPCVSRSNLDGSDVKTLFKKPIVQWPNGITVDQMSERIYWVDAMEDYIASSDLNGLYFKRILWNDERVSHPFAVAVLKDKMYWDDWKKKSIFIADKDTGMNVITINDSLSGLMDLKVFAHFTQYGSNACSYKNISCDTMCLGGPANTFSCLCPEGFKMTNGTCMCLNGMAPTANMTCPPKSGGNCDPLEFTCKTGKCINAFWRCDGDYDCDVFDISDEQDCDINNCTDNQFQCTDKQCITKSWQCDGDKDCKDGSDERNCSIVPVKPICHQNTFSCGNDSHLCIPNSWVCDGTDDCLSAEDEKDCGINNCTDNQFQCASGRCIEKRWQCDGDNDCTDGSDEHNCSVVSGRPQPSCEYGFSCGKSSDNCLPYSWVCDGEKDCASGEDEKDELCKDSTCAPYMYRCPSGKCIFRSWVCDGENDCKDIEESDEKNCTQYSTTRDPNLSENGCFINWMFDCNNRRCIPFWWKCNGRDDCGDNSDEVGCPVTPKPEPTPAPQKCWESQFTCSPDSDLCIPLTWVCDGGKDCSQGEDEKGCRARARVTSPCREPDVTVCADGRGCFPDFKLCNNEFDCADHSDEALCSNNIFLIISVEESSINSTSFLIYYWMAQQKNMVLHSFLPSIANVSDGKWTNKTWTNDSIYEFTNLEPFTNYNVTFYIRDQFNKTYASNSYFNVTTGEGVPSPPRNVILHQVDASRLQVTWDAPEFPRGIIQHYVLKHAPPVPPMQRIISAGNQTTYSVIVNSYFEPHVNYSFWVDARNNNFTSERNDINTANVTFDDDTSTYVTYVPTEQYFTLP